MTRQHKDNTREDNTRRMLSRSAWLVGAALIRTPTAPRPRSWDDEDDGKVEEDSSDDDEDGH
eukprot:5704734-Heterocapsa_arctica.AAC.1